MFKEVSISYIIKNNSLFSFIVKSFKHTHKTGKQDNNHLTITYVQKLFSHFSELFQSKSQSFILPLYLSIKAFICFSSILYILESPNWLWWVSYSKASINQKGHLQISSNPSFWEQTRNVYSFHFFSLFQLLAFPIRHYKYKMFNLFPEKSVENYII